MSEQAKPKRKRIKYDRDGIPVDPIDWTYADWCILWQAIQTARAKIADNHRERRAIQEDEPVG